MFRSSLQLGNPAGVAWNLADGFSQRGWSSVVVELEPEVEGFPANVQLHMTRSTNLFVRGLNLVRIARLARKADIVHFHFGIRPFGRYLRKLCSAPFVVHFHGSDLRERISDGYRNLGSAEFVSTPDLKQWAPRATWIPNPIRIPRPSPREKRDLPVVGHFPSDPRKKGTALIVEAVRRLQTQIEFEFRLISGVSHELALQQMRGCDVVIDQVSPFGVYGMVAVEAMSLGRVVLSSIETSYYEQCPIIPVTQENLSDRLAGVLSSPEKWVKLGDEGRQYVGKVHDPAHAASLVVEQYEKIQ